MLPGSILILNYPAAMASSDLLWALTKKQNAFLVKRNGLQLTSEPNNVMGVNSFKYSGLANAETVGVEDNTRGANLTLA